MTAARSIASPRFREEMSQPVMTRSFGLTMGSMELNGTYTSLPAQEPRRTVDDCVSDPT